MRYITFRFNKYMKKLIQFKKYNIYKTFLKYRGKYYWMK